MQDADCCDCRVIGALVNSKEFAATFKCKEDSAMDKCELW